MELIKLQEKKEPASIDDISRALASIYTGIFLIDLVHDNYVIIKSSKEIASMLEQIGSAQQAINVAIQRTVFPDELSDVQAFMNLASLPERMKTEKCLNIDYEGMVSGWVKGSFIEMKRDNTGKLEQILYTYQTINKEKRKELENLQQLKDDYARTEKDNEAAKEAFAREKVVLEDRNTLLTNENVELQRARDAVYTMVKAGSYLCTFAEDGETLLSIEFSDALRKLYGYSNEEDAPNTWEMWIQGAHPEERKYVEDSFLSALRDKTGKTDYSVTYRGVKKDGTIRWYRANGYVIRREDGTAELCYGLITDIDEQKKASDLLEEALEQARLANEAKTSFLARMSHDIRTPMNGIMGLIEINEKHADDIAFTTKNRRKAKVAANHLLSLINDVLQLSKLESSNIEFAEVPFNMLALLDDIFTITEMRAGNNGITVKRNQAASVEEYPYLWGSPLHVRQIYINLLGNSIKYNKKNGSILCSASAERTDQNHVLFKMVIKDTGIGIGKEFQEHLFDPFTREHEEMNGKYEGTGLGLSIVKQLIDKMGGSIQVESEVDEGTCFTVEIPFRLASEEDAMKTEVLHETGNIDGKNILLVEDNELNMEIAEILLTDAGACVTKAVNGQQAVDIFRANSPGTFDVILMDVMMPVMNGYDATRAIRLLERPDAKEIPIIAMTANAFTEDVDKAKQVGMNEHLAKPLDIQKLLAVIAKYGMGEMSI